MDDLVKQEDISSIQHQALCNISKPWVNSNWSYSLETLISGQNRWFIIRCKLEIGWMTLINDKAPLWCYFKLCASFCSHWWIQTGVTVLKCSISVTMDDFFLPCDLEMLWMSLKNNRAPLLCCFKLCALLHTSDNSNLSYSPETLYSGQNRFFCHIWPWNLTDDLKKQTGTSSMLFQALYIIL